MVVLKRERAPATSSLEPMAGASCVWLLAAVAGVGRERRVLRDEVPVFVVHFETPVRVPTR